MSFHGTSQWILFPCQISSSCIFSQSRDNQSCISLPIWNTNRVSHYLISSSAVIPVLSTLFGASYYLNLVISAFLFGPMWESETEPTDVNTVYCKIWSFHVHFQLQSDRLLWIKFRAVLLGVLWGYWESFCVEPWTSYLSNCSSQSFWSKPLFKLDTTDWNMILIQI